MYTDSAFQRSFRSTYLEYGPKDFSARTLNQTLINPYKTMHVDFIS